MVLFPRTVVPLHIFEGRYIRMVEDALASDRRIAIAHLRKGWEKDYYGNPKVHRMITIARILDEDRLEGGRFNILLEGIERAEIVEELDHKPYRQVKATPLVDLLTDEEMPEIREQLEDLKAMARRVADYQPKLVKTLTNLTNQYLHPGIIADIVAAQLVMDSYERQSLLEQTRVLRRLQLMNVQLRRQVADFERANHDRFDHG